MMAAANAGKKIMAKVASGKKGQKVMVGGPLPERKKVHSEKRDSLHNSVISGTNAMDGLSAVSNTAELRDLLRARRKYT